MGYIIPVTDDEESTLCVEHRRESFTIYQGQGFDGRIEIPTTKLAPLIKALLEVAARERGYRATPEK